MTAPIHRLTEELGTVGHNTVLLDIRAAEIVIQQPGAKHVRFDRVVADYVCLALLQAISQIVPDPLERSGGYVTKVWLSQANGGCACIQTVGKHDGPTVWTRDPISLVLAIHTGRMVLDGRP
jgi:hypothetical protein